LFVNHNDYEIECNVTKECLKEMIFDSQREQNKNDFSKLTFTSQDLSSGDILQRRKKPEYP